MLLRVSMAVQLRLFGGEAVMGSPSRRRAHPIVVLCCVFLAVGACSRDDGAPNAEPAQESVSDAAPDEMVARVDGQPITATALRKEMVRRGADFLDRFDELEEKEEVLEDLIRLEIMAQAAAKSGYAEDPEIQSGLKRMMAEKYWRDQVVQRRVEESIISDEDVRAYYESQAERWTEPERRRAAVIVLRFPPRALDADKEVARARLRGALKEARKQAGAIDRTFGPLARAHSDDPGSRERGGDIGWIPKGASIYRWDPRVVDTLFKLEKVGDVSAPVETETAIHLVKLVDRSGGTVRELSTVEAQIRSEIEAERGRTADDRQYRQLREEFEVAIDRVVLARVGPQKRAAADGDGPPAFPVGEQAQ